MELFFSSEACCYFYLFRITFSSTQCLTYNILWLSFYSFCAFILNEIKTLSSNLFCSLYRSYMQPVSLTSKSFYCCLISSPSGHSTLNLSWNSLLRCDSRLPHVPWGDGYYRLPDRRRLFSNLASVYSGCSVDLSYSSFAVILNLEYIVLSCSNFIP